MPMEELLNISDLNIVDIPEPQKKKILEAFNLFVKTVKARLVYPATSRLPQQFKEDLYIRIAALCDELGNLSFNVESDRITYNNSLEVYKAASKTDNFAHLFFRDGIMNFQIASGVTAPELDTLIDITSKMMRAASQEDDMATLMWESAFKHITYKLMDDVFNIDTFEYGIDSLKAPANSKIDLKGLYENEIDLEITAEDFEVPTEEQKKKARQSPYVAEAGSISEFIRRAATYDESEKKEIEAMLASDVQFDFKAYIIDLLFEILGLETDNAGYHESLELFSKVRDDFIRVGDFKSAQRLLERVRELEQAFKNLKDLKLDKVQGFIESFGSSEKIKIIVNTLNQSKDIDYDEVTSYLKLLPWQAVPPLVASLGDLTQFAGRRAVCRALVTLGADRIEMVARGLEDPRWFVVRNIVGVLGQIGNPKALAYFKRTIQHADIRVRKETLVAVGKIKCDEAYNFLIMALDDDDESIQSLALKELVTYKVTRAYSPIKDIISDKDFKERPTDQIKEFLEALAQLGGERAFEELKKIATRNSLLASEKQKRLKNYAVRAMSYMQTPEAASLLEKIAKSRDRALADTARRALFKKTKGE